MSEKSFRPPPDSHGDDMEDELIARARTGDREAIERLLQRHRGDLRRFARKMCRSEDADDAVQHGMIQLATHASAFRGAAKLTSWLFTIVKRECMRLVRVVRGTADIHPLDSASDPEVLLAIERALASLDAPLREVLILRDIEELTGPEAAERLGITLEAMKTRLHHARARMREALT
jgi:RNA polymerase sigma factor (sigma-70 family)